jgi:hypothetical protein
MTAVPYFLLKTFSMNPFQGQYPKSAVKINATPINPTTQGATPEKKKAAMIKTIPAIARKMTSPPTTFFRVTTGFISHLLWDMNLQHKNPISPEKRGSV